MSKKHAADETVTTLVSFAERARREGLLALEEMAKSVDDPFLRKGIELAVDGTDPDELRDILEAEIASKKTADKAEAKFFADMGGFAPTLGIIGTVLGLIHVLENLSEPEKLGHLIAGAFVATLWGVLTANVMWLPIGNKLKRVGRDRGPPHGAGDGGRPRRPGRRQPPRHRAEAALVPARPASGRDRAPRRRPEPMATAAAKSHRRSKLHEEHEEHENHERWLITYADMITLLMVLFIVLYSISQVDLAKFRRLKEGVAGGFGGPAAAGALSRRGRPAGRRRRRLRRRPPRHRRRRRSAQAGQAALADAEARTAGARQQRSVLQGAQQEIQRSLDKRGPRRHGPVPSWRPGAWSSPSSATRCCSSRARPTCGPRAGTSSTSWPPPSAGCPTSWRSRATPTTSRSRAGTRRTGSCRPPGPPPCSGS